MAQHANPIAVYLEIGRKRTLAAALDWPGWCRGGRDEAAALQALCDYGPRYARVLAGTALAFRAPPGPAALAVVERAAGNATTDFGAPAVVLARDADPVGPAELERWQEVLDACGRALDAAAQAAEGRTLATGPRGGGRELAGIVQHVRESAAAYLRSLGGTPPPDEGDPAALRAAILAALAASVRGEIPSRGPRGGLRWAPRYFVRRLAWHVLDHAWEIEDRAG